jgi:hypothetical protein
MDTLFYLARGGQPLTIRLINKALVSYQSRKGQVHERIRSWIDLLESKFDHLDAKRGIDKMARIIEEHCIKPENGASMQEGGDLADEAWISEGALRGAA